VISRLPRWVAWGAATLALMAGMVNVVGLLSFEHQAITHLTGTTSQVSAALAAGDLAAAGHFALVIAAFFAGTVASGFVIQDSTLRLGRRYSVALLVECALLVAAAGLLERSSVYGLYFAASACGLQNALVSAYSGALIRTTHLSGMFTDLGIFLGHRLRGLPVDARRVRLCLVVIGGFALGGVAGAALHRRWAAGTLLIPAALAAASATAYGIHHWRRARSPD
jgi:uncharacterized membrane protein YoaK (UPF0700 family)